MLGIPVRATLVLAAAVAAGAGVPAVGQAAEWTVDGVRSNATADVSGLITLVPASSSLRVSCLVNLQTSHANTALTANVSVTSASFPTCGTNVAGCDVTAAATALPWNGAGDLSGADPRVDVAGVSFTNTFSAGCPSPLSGGTFSETGTLTPKFVASSQSLLLDGTSASGTVSGPLGTATLDGGFDLRVSSPVGGHLGLQ